MSPETPKPVVWLPSNELQVQLEGDEDWLSTLENPHDTTTLA